MGEPGVFETEWGEAIGKVLAAYPMGSPGLVLALETLCKTAEERGHMEGTRTIAMGVCEQLHSTPATGLKCLQCYNAEQNYREETTVAMEVAAAAKAKGEK